MSTHAASAPLAELIGHLTSSHHALLRAELPRLAALTAEAARTPGPHQAWLRQSATRLARFAADMIGHLDHEEQVIFPLILAIERGGPEADAARRALRGQLAALEMAHVGTGAELDELHRICDTVPAQADAEPVLAELLEAYARVITDTHAHVVLENEVLLPRALALPDSRSDLA